MRPAILDVDVGSVAAQIGHAAAANSTMALRDGRELTELDLEWWAVTASTFPATNADAAIDALGAYVCQAKEPVSGEVLFRKAAELRLHRLPPDKWRGLTVSQRLAYELFASATRMARNRLLTMQAELRPPAPRKAAPAHLTERIGERELGRLERDPDLRMKRRPAQRDAADRRLGGEENSTALDPASVDRGMELRGGAIGGGMTTAKLAIGDRPLDLAKQRPKKRGGARKKAVDA